MPPSSSDDHGAFLDFATEIARAAGELTLSYFQSGVSVERKPDDSPVTVADREAERLLRDRIAARFPDHAIIGEELGEERGEKPAEPQSHELGTTTTQSRHRWILDPIDGTQSFIRGVPLYGVLVALEIDGAMRVGVAHFPALGETVRAASGAGCWWNDRRASVSSTDDLASAALVYTSLDDLHRLRAEAWQRLRTATRVQRGWGDCYGHCLVATGRADVALDPITNLWDCAALQPIVEEAGGTFTDWSGRPGPDHGEAISTNPALLPAVTALTAPGQPGQQ